MQLRAPPPPTMNLDAPADFSSMSSMGLECMRRKIDEYNMYLNYVCAHNYHIELAEYKAKSKNDRFKINFELKLMQDNPYEYMCDVKCEIRCVPANDLSLIESRALNFLTNRIEVDSVGALIVGALDSTTDEKYQGKGYNKFMRTCAYNIMRACFRAHIIATNAVAIETFHVLTDYFAFATPVHIRNEMIDRAINQLTLNQPIDMYSIEIHDQYPPEKRALLIKRLTEQKARNIQDDARAIQLLESLKQTDLYNYNMICDLTDGAKVDILNQMEAFVFACECPPCGVALAVGEVRASARPP